MYNETFVSHFQNPRNVGELDPPAVSVQVENPACGDILRLSALWVDGRITAVRYKVRGCPASIAAGSALTEWLMGKTRPQLAALQPECIDAAVGGLIPESKHAAILCVDGALRLAAVYTQTSVSS